MPQPGIKLMSPALQGGFLTTGLPGTSPQPNFNPDSALTYMHSTQCSPSLWPQLHVLPHLPLCVFSRSVMSNSVTLWTLPARLLCLWDPPGKNAGVGCHFSSRRSSRPRDRNCVSFISCGSTPLSLAPPGKFPSPTSHLHFPHPNQRNGLSSLEENIFCFFLLTCLGINYLFPHLVCR